LPDNALILGWSFGLAMLIGVSLAGCAAEPTEAPAPPALAPLSSSERTQLYEQQVQSARDMLLAAHPSASVPDVALIRYVLPSEWAVLISQCMTDAGFDASLRPDGGVDYVQVPEVQGQAQATAHYVCSVQYPLDPIYARPLNQEQLDYLYWYFTKELTPCLEREGHSISTAPSFSTFVDQYAAAPWTPYSDVVTTSNAEWMALNEECPQVPEELFGAHG
jgi:hypothetical protein